MADRVKLYNKGKRIWDIIDPEQGRVWIQPERAKDVDKVVAEKYVRLYPKEFVIGGPAGSGTEEKKLKERIEALEKENAELKAKLGETSEETPVDLSRMNKAALIEYATKECGLEVDEEKTKAQIIEMIKAKEEETNEGIQ
jgi:hypothetical protein